MNIQEFDKLTNLTIQIIDLCKLVIQDHGSSAYTKSLAESVAHDCARMARCVRMDAEYEAGLVAEWGGPCIDLQKEDEDGPEEP